MPEITLTSTLGSDTATWRPKKDLLSSGPTATEIVVETERDGGARLRLGDDTHGARPEAGTAFTATYRVGNGTVGNIGAEALVHVSSVHPASTGVRNPMSAWGGTDAETIEDVRQRAPSAFKTQERAVTAEDYADVTERMAESYKGAYWEFFTLSNGGFYMAPAGDEVFHVTTNKNSNHIFLLVLHLNLV